MIGNVLSIAGSDPSGGAGIQADLKTFSALGCYGMAVLTALTAQNTRGVSGVHVPPAAFVAAQIDAIFEDVEVHAVKIGMLASGDIVEMVADRLRAHGARNIVLDPVLVATSGDSLGAPDVVDAMKRHLFPLASVVTPNVPEAVRLGGGTAVRDLAGLEALARALHAQGAQAVLVKGGHLGGAFAEDVLFDGAGVQVFKAERVATRNTHGTGCTLSSAIAAYLAQGKSLAEAVALAKDYLTDALRAADELHVGSGKGHGPVHHFHALWR
ncbi:bifunctional hydroxymethylpyrimidine kinase/phosphomethylpyrimidine kinase [Roseiarcaceae bacterium H3SJ34-1]|uniref:bifunctional hydroxymethylpyrimidine kinase/phosphomethylpyrimidine kinase n=1 Tax=Terripilifer ovatus TaxID=3032367 RepID=UPI003AB95D20|nr:bifunctional hydroxymethylpyrimidine kinase/phosphomethylpyrimidine kinase [Roseiarcaceae bacterium H3SJ34-1]